MGKYMMKADEVVIRQARMAANVAEAAVEYVLDSETDMPDAICYDDLSEAVHKLLSEVVEAREITPA